MDKNYCVYVHILPNDKKYYGMTSQNPKKRWNHGYGYKGKNIEFFNDVLFYGWDNIEHIVVAKGLTKEEAEWLEEELIRTNRTYDSEYGYNIKIGNKFIMTEEHKVKISEANRGKCGIDGSHRKPVICITTMTVFNTIKEASTYYKTHSSRICSCCRGKHKSAGKFNGQKLVWRYIDIIEL